MSCPVNHNLKPVIEDNHSVLRLPLLLTKTFRLPFLPGTQSQGTRHEQKRLLCEMKQLESNNERGPDKANNGEWLHD